MIDPKLNAKARKIIKEALDETPAWLDSESEFTVKKDSNRAKANKLLQWHFSTEPLGGVHVWYLRDLNHWYLARSAHALATGQAGAIADLRFHLTWHQEITGQQWGQVLN